MNSDFKIIDEDVEKSKPAEIKEIVDDKSPIKTEEVNVIKKVSNIKLPEWSIDVPLEIKRGNK